MTAQNTALRSGQPSAAAHGDSGSLEVVVLHTTTKATLRNLRTAAELATGLAAHIRLLVLEVVPYPLQLDSPGVPVEFTQRRFRTVASAGRIDTLVDIRLGRERFQMLESALKPGSVVVLEGGAWWTRQRRLAKRLERLGHQVVLTKSTRRGLTYVGSVLHLGRDHLFRRLLVSDQGLRKALKGI